MTYDGADIEDAYAIQKAWVQLKLAEGQKIVGHKIVLTSRAMQMSSQINEPDFGTLLDNPAQGMMLFTMGKLKVSNVGLALSLQKILG